MSPEEKKKLRARAHPLKPVVIVGQAGVSDAVLAEIESALDHHELIKVKIKADDREARKQAGASICAATGAETVQSIGQILTIYRKHPDKRG
ncbi:MAG: ribosome assembly RNA-binding protein YhbY [Pseudomonadota bacterium]